MVRIELENEDDRGLPLRAGMSVSVTIDTNPTEAEDTDASETSDDDE
jgi:multidrug resistance efflux pump